MTTNETEMAARYVLSDRPGSSYTLGLRDLAAMPHVSVALGDVFRDCAGQIEHLQSELTAAKEALEVASPVLYRLATAAECSLGDQLAYMKIAATLSTIGGVK